MPSFMMRAAMRRRAILCIAALTALACVSASPVWGQDTAIVVTVGSDCLWSCDSTRVPVYVLNSGRTIEGYRLRFTLSRPGLVYYDPAHLASCAGAAAASWELCSGSLPYGDSSSVQALGIADLPGVPGSPPGLAPSATRYLLVYLGLRALCDPDTISGTQVAIVPTLTHEFTDKQGALIAPVAARGDTITLISSALGDLDGSGYFDLVDVVKAVNCAFRNDCPGCKPRIADVNCDGTVTVQDVVLLIGHVFRGASAPACP